MADGNDYRARVGISDAAGLELAAAGETCERVPTAALGWLEACGAIERLAEGEGIPAADAAAPADEKGEA